MKAFEIFLTEPQRELFQPAFKRAHDRGDCQYSRQTASVRFVDYEGVQGTIRDLADLATTAGARRRKSWLAVKSKIDAGCRGEL